MWSHRIVKDSSIALSANGRNGNVRGLIWNVKSAYSEVEPWSGALFSLETCSYSDNPNTVLAGEGVETAEDWTRARRMGWATLGTNGTHLKNDENYLRHILGAESINLVGVLSLARAFDFRRYGSIFEI